MLQEFLIPGAVFGSHDWGPYHFLALPDLMPRRVNRGQENQNLGNGLLFDERCQPDAGPTVKQVKESGGAQYCGELVDSGAVAPI